jgi:hypothetical protein
VSEFKITRRVREICLAVTEVTERAEPRGPASFVGRQFVVLWPDGHHDVVRHTSGALSCTATKTI